jgi:hypothetical protein
VHDGWDDVDWDESIAEEETVEEDPLHERWEQIDHRAMTKAEKRFVDTVEAAFPDPSQKYKKMELRIAMDALIRERKRRTMKQHGLIIQAALAGDLTITERDLVWSFPSKMRAELEEFKEFPPA